MVARAGGEQPTFIHAPHPRASRARRFLLTSALVLSLIAPQATASRAEAKQIEGDYIVVLRNDVESLSKTDALEKTHGFKATHRYRVALRGFAAHLNDQQLQRLSTDAAVAYITPDREVKLADVPIAPGDSAPAGVRRIGSATSITARQASVVNVAVIDTGIDLQHPDLNAVNGTNCIKPNQAAQDDHGHGSHVAGTIGAKNNGAGVIGVAPGTRLYAVKVINAQGTGTTSQVICGIDWVTANATALQIKVANMSLGDTGSDDGRCGDVNHDAMHRAICNSVAAGITYVAGAGNDSGDLATFVPAAYREVLAVTAIADYDGLPGGLGSPSCFDGFLNGDDTPAFFSNFATEGSSAQAHTIAGPGVCVTSTWLNRGYSTISGTSMATPHVAGSVALCFGDGGTAGPCSGLPSAQVITKMISTAAAYANANPDNGFDGDPLHPSGGSYYGYLVWAGPPPVPDTTPPVISAVGVSVTQSSATITWTTDEAADSQVEYGTTTAYGSSSPLDQSRVTAHSVRLDGLATQTTYHFLIKSKDAAGNLATSGDRTFTTAPPAADLALSGTVSPNPVPIGSPLAYALTALNKGPNAASGVTLTDTLPANASFVSATASQGSCAQSAGQVSCALGALGAGYPAQVLADQPIGYWRLDETSGTVAADSSGNGRSGTIDAGVSLGASPLAGGGGAAVSLPGTGPIVRVVGIGSALQESAAGQTLEFWADPDPADSEWIAVGLAPAGADEIQRYSDGLGYWATFRTGRLAGLPTRASGVHHFVITRQPGVGWKLYIDGALA
ncbi:MAG TPA: S8 family serine peptidase, partial [Candidatus Limnocylindria bacterium]|nr:S8 family serine peptidase [Candidatus Limnocylindria bacterium]